MTTLDDLLSVYRSSVARDLVRDQIGEDIAFSISTVFARVHEELAIYKAGAHLGTATGLYLDLHGRDRDMRRQDLIEGERSTLTLPWGTVVELRATGVPVDQTITVYSGPTAIVNEATLPDIEIEFVDGVTTIRDIEALINAAPTIRVKTPAAIDRVLVDPTDLMGTAIFTGGTDDIRSRETDEQFYQRLRLPQSAVTPRAIVGALQNIVGDVNTHGPVILIEIPQHAAFADRAGGSFLGQFDGGFYDRGLRIGGGRGVVVILIPASADAMASVSDATRLLVSAGKIWLVEEYQ